MVHLPRIELVASSTLAGRWAGYLAARSRTVAAWVRDPRSERRKARSIRSTAAAPGRAQVVATLTVVLTMGLVVVARGAVTHAPVTNETPAREPPLSQLPLPSLQSSLRLAVLNVHLEGNLGDEYETTPLLSKLFEWGARLDLYLAAWQPKNSIGPGAVRQVRFVQAIYNINEWIRPARKTGRLVGGAYDVLISAPGPLPLSPDILRKLAQHSNATLIIAGISNCAGKKSDVFPADLVLFRESESLRQAKAQADAGGANKRAVFAQSPSMVLSGDFSFSFQPDGALLDYWVRHYRERVLRAFGQGGGVERALPSAVQHGKGLERDPLGAFGAVRLWQCGERDSYNHRRREEPIAAGDRRPHG